MDARISTIIAANRAGWNQIAHRRSGRPVEEFRDGAVGLEDFEVELAGDVSGRRVLQLACSYGDEVLSWANLGAQVTGVDISDVAIENARERAAAAGIAADFRRADMGALPAYYVMTLIRGGPDSTSTSWRRSVTAASCDDPGT